MPNDAWKIDDYVTLDLVEEDSSTATPVAGLQDLTINPGVSVERLYTADSIKIEEQMQHEFEVPVDIGYSLWDVDVVKQWLGGQGGTAQSTMADTSDPQKFQIDFTLDSVRGERTLGGDVNGDGSNQPVRVTGITFESMPIVDASRGEFEQWDLSGTGEDIAQVDVVDNTA